MTSLEARIYQTIQTLEQLHNGPVRPSTILGDRYRDANYAAVQALIAAGRVVVTHDPYGNGYYSTVISAGVAS